VLGAGEPGPYNLAGPGKLTISDLAAGLGWHSVPTPRLAVGAAAEAVARLPFLPDEAAWVEAARRPVLMDVGRARERLGWEPRHDAHETLRQTIAVARAR
jgi:UDP-glucose 4-epimerase